MSSEIISLLNISVRLLWTRFLCAALAMSVFIAVLVAARKRLSLVLRSWLWGAAFVGLWIPFNRYASSLLEVYNVEGFSRSKFLTLLSNAHILPLLRFLEDGASYIWLSGFLFFAIYSSMDVHKTHRLLRKGKIAVCAAYFYRWRSHIYLPPNFETMYHPEEQAMLLAHEKQHITQHDPLLYRLLLALQCVFWFCPPVHKAARLFQQDRELLCDQRVLQCCSKQEYGLLLLKEAKKKPVGRSATGIVSETSSVSERIESIVKPNQTSKITAAVIFLALATLFGIGLSDRPHSDLANPFLGNITIHTRYDLIIDANYQLQFQDPMHFIQIQGLAHFIQISEDDITFDQTAMYEHALAIGLTPEDQIGVSIVTDYRTNLLWGIHTDYVEYRLTVGDLLTETVITPYSDPLYRVRSFLHKYL